MKLIHLCLAGLFLLPSCGTAFIPEDPEPEYVAPVPIELTKADLAVRDASNATGLDIFQRLCAVRGGDDVSFSPLSLSLAFAMLTEGAEGETYKQLTEVFGWAGVTKEELGAFYKKMIAGLVTADPQVSFTSSNSFWAANDLDLLPRFTSLLKENFDAESYVVDFALAATLDKINAWCSEKTDGKIPRMLDELNPKLRLMLINALLYKAPWQYDWTVLQNRDFHTGSATVRKDYLHAKREYGYADLSDCEAVSLPYGNGAYEMVVFLPRQGKTVEEVLPTVVQEAGSLYLSSRTVEVFLPKWSTEYSTKDYLIPTLQEKGLLLPFSNAADFSQISASEALKVSQVLQKVKIDVTEKGTEFAAVTVIGLEKATSVMNPPKPVVFDADHPFIYLIRERSSGAILLLGTLSK